MSIGFNIVFHALESIMSFFLIGCVGYVLARRGWFSKESNTLILRLVTVVALPPYLLYNINTSISRADLFSMGRGLMVAFASVFICIGIGLLLEKALKPSPRRSGVIHASFAFSNTIYIGIPVNLALFGEKSLPYILLYYFANSSQFWTMGNYFLSSRHSAKKAKIFSLAAARRVFSPPMFGFVSGVLLLLLDARLPTVLATTAKSLGGLTTPLVILSIGVTISEMGFGKIRFDAELLTILAGRFVVSPLVLIALTRLFPLPEMMLKVFIIQASLPAMTSVAALAGYYKSDADFATVVVITTTLCALVTIPAYMLLLSALT